MALSSHRSGARIILRRVASFAATNKLRIRNLMFHFLPLAIRYDGSAPRGGHGYQVHVGPCILMRALGKNQV
ncbi:oxygen-dependent choline dehydrogenase [Anaerolineaceae bacterium]|nr:oxygen-dependent choline dehydrogenase [Anaerolineaceae bacterium]